MKTYPNGLIWLVLVYSFILTILFLIPVAAQRPYSDFNLSGDIASVEQAFSTKGLKICDKEELNWSITPGFVSGKVYDLNMNCSNFNPNYPAARLWLVKFSYVESRDAALRNFETARRHIGLGVARTKGPMIMLIDGSQKPEMIAALRDFASQIGFS